ncbi:MAG: hypothetical protein H0T92_00125 [Pyrinomonadaceae bacterium]|nr:hypothetical protein [Pyrinomonadaceae bacterium]
MLRLARSALTILLLTLAVDLPTQAAPQDAHDISANIQRLHMPHGTIIDPMFKSEVSTEVYRYTRGADSAIWTGHYLAAEAFRYRATGSPQALGNVWRALRGIRSLIDVTGTNLLARCLMPVAWEDSFEEGVDPQTGIIKGNKRGIITEEAGHGVYIVAFGGTNYYWIGNTSRDQYSGVFFGLGVAYDMIDDASVRSFIRADVTRLLDFLLQHNWAVVMPSGAISTVFWHRSDQQLSFLQVGRRVNPTRFDSIYRSYRSKYAPSVAIPISTEVLDDHNSYFKFNLDTINLYNLIRLEDSSYYRWWYTSAYNLLRRTTDDHGNAHFNMIDRGLKGADSIRDAQTRSLLDEWLMRPRRDFWVDLRGDVRYPVCGEDRACSPIPVKERVRTDFLWQRSPFLLYGGGSGTIETAGIDYILPYWMARYYGVLSGA